MSMQARPESAAEPAPEPYVPWCTHCGTDDYLIIESVEPALGDDAAEFLEISYTCSECDRFYGHPVRRSPLWARRLNANTAEEAQYMHCGEPMQPKDITSVSIFEPLHTGAIGIVPEVQLETAVLRCRCGFQISVPA